VSFDQAGVRQIDERQEYLRRALWTQFLADPKRIKQRGHGSAPPGAGYLFLTGALAAAVFGAMAEDAPATGEITFLGCLGFLASRLPRIVLFAKFFSRFADRESDSHIAQCGRIRSVCRDLYFLCAVYVCSGGGRPIRRREIRRMPLPLWLLFIRDAVRFPDFWHSRLFFLPTLLTPVNAGVAVGQ
jgi:hypothetical protein